MMLLEMNLPASSDKVEQLKHLCKLIKLQVGAIPSGSLVEYRNKPYYMIREGGEYILESRDGERLLIDPTKSLKVYVPRLRIYRSDGQVFALGVDSENATLADGNMRLIGDTIRLKADLIFIDEKYKLPYSAAIRVVVSEEARPYSGFGVYTADHLFVPLGRVSLTKILKRDGQVVRMKNPLQLSDNAFLNLVYERDRLLASDFVEWKFENLLWPLDSFFSRIPHYHRFSLSERFCWGNTTPIFELNKDYQAFRTFVLECKEIFSTLNLESVADPTPHGLPRVEDLVNQEVAE